MDLNKITYVFEGQDGVGKSTIIKELQKRLPNLKYYHFEYPYGNSNEERYGYQWGQFDMMFKFIKLSQEKVQYIFDRAHIGEYVWSPKYREREPEYLPILENKYKDLPIVLILVECDPKEVEQRLNSRSDETAPPIDDIKFLKEQFKIHCEKSSFPLFKVDTTGCKNPNNLIDLLLEEITNYESD